MDNITIILKGVSEMKLIFRVGNENRNFINVNDICWYQYLKCAALNSGMPVKILDVPVFIHLVDIWFLMETSENQSYTNISDLDMPKNLWEKFWQ